MAEAVGIEPNALRHSSLSGRVSGPSGLQLPGARRRGCKPQLRPCRVRTASGGGRESRTPASYGPRFSKPVSRHRDFILHVSVRAAGFEPAAVLHPKQADDRAVQRPDGRSDWNRTSLILLPKQVPRANRLHSGAESRNRTELAGFSDQCNHQTCSLCVTSLARRAGRRQCPVRVSNPSCRVESPATGPSSTRDETEPAVGVEPTGSRVRNGRPSTGA